MDEHASVNDVATAGSSQAVPLSYDSLIESLRSMRDGCASAAERVSVRSGAYKAGSGGWWELNGYATVLNDAITRIVNHRRRVDGIDAQIARERMTDAKAKAEGRA